MICILFLNGLGLISAVLAEVECI